MAIGVYICLGAALAAFHAALLVRSVQLHGAGRSGGAAVLGFARALAVPVAFIALALGGARPLACSAIGFTCAYPAIVGALRRFV